MPRKFTPGWAFAALQQEESLARADLELDGIGIAEQARPVDRRRRLAQPARVDQVAGDVDRGSRP